MDTNPGIQKKPRLGWLEIAILSFFVLILVMIAIPYFIAFDEPIFRKSKSAEAKTNLAAISIAQAIYHRKQNTYAGGPEAFKLLKWEPNGNNLYAYACGDAYIPNQRGDLRATSVVPPWPAGIRPASSQTGFTCFAVGNVDNDTGLDYWTIDDARQLKNVVNDR